FAHPGVWRGFDYAAMADRVAAGKTATTATGPSAETAAGPADGPTARAATAPITRQAPGPGHSVRRLTAYDVLPDGDPALLPCAPENGTAVRWIYWTSGTTSDPRGVRHTDRSLIAGGSCLAHA